MKQLYGFMLRKKGHESLEGPPRTCFAGETPEAIADIIKEYEKEFPGFDFVPLEVVPTRERNQKQNGKHNDN